MTNIEKVALPAAAIENLTHHQQQADMDGTFVKVSRQALDEVLSFIAAMQPAPQEPVADDWRKFELWLFRECNEGTRRHLWAIFGLPVDEITNHGMERHALSLVKRALAPLYAGPTPPAGGSDAE